MKAAGVKRLAVVIFGSVEGEEKYDAYAESEEPSEHGSNLPCQGRENKECGEEETEKDEDAATDFMREARELVLHVGKHVVLLLSVGLFRHHRHYSLSGGGVKCLR